MDPSLLLPYQIETSKAYQAYLNGSADMLEIFKQALKIDENYFTVMNLCVIYLVQRNFNELDELINKANTLADGHIHHILFQAEMNLLIHDYDKAIILLVQIFNDPDQYEVVQMLLKQIFNNKLYSKKHLSTLISDNNILQKIIKINKNIFTKVDTSQFQSYDTTYSQKQKDSLNQSLLSNSGDAKTFMQLNLSKQSSIQDPFSKQSSALFSNQSQEITKTLSYVTDRTDQLSFISTSNSTATTSNGSLIDFSFIDIIIENPNLFSFQFRIPYMIGSYDIREMNKLEQKIAEGGFGAVYVSKHLKTNEIHAVKVIKEQEDQDVNLILQEIIIQDQIQNLNPNLFLNLKPQVYLKKQNKLVDIYIPLELAQFSLFDYLKEVQVDEEEYIQFYNLFIDFIVTLHQNQYAHRDIKPQNILYVKDVGWKLADFGESIKYNQVDGLYKIRGTLAFLPQKLRRQQKQQSDAKQNLLYNDVYAIVCTLIMIKNPNINSKGLTDIMDSNQFDDQQQLLLKNFNDLNKLNQLKINQTRIVQTKIIIKQQIQEQQSSWDCLERFQFCLDQQLPLEDDLVQKLDELLGVYNQKGQTNQQILYSILISNAFPFQIDRFKNIIEFNFYRHQLAITVVADHYGYYRQIVRYLTIVKLYDLSIYICDTIMNIDYEIIAHLLKIETLRLSDRINEAKQELELAFRYLLQVQSYTLDEQILFVELYQKLHNEVPQIKADKILQQHMTKITTQNKIESQFHDIDDGSLIPINVNDINEKQHLQIRLDVLLKSIYHFPQRIQPKLYQCILYQFGSQFLIDDRLTNIDQLIQFIKENLIFWNTVYHQKIQIIAVGLSQIFCFYGKYHAAFQIGSYFHKILMNFGSWNNIFCQYEHLFQIQLMLYLIYGEPPTIFFDVDACVQEVKYLSLFENVYARLRVSNYLFNLTNNYKFTNLSEQQVQFFEKDLKSYFMGGIDILKMFLVLQETTDVQRLALQCYVEKMLISILNYTNIDWVIVLQVIKKLHLVQFRQNEEIITFENFSIPQLDLTKQHRTVSRLFRKILLSQDKMNINSFKQHKFYYKTISKIYTQPLKVLNHQRRLGEHYKESLLVSSDDKLNNDLSYFLWSHKQFRHTKLSQKMEKKIDQINIFQQYLNY
ncbi:hypothetical protein pb186bvf_016908 [Paramecium bursaria]